MCSYVLQYKIKSHTSTIYVNISLINKMKELKLVPHVSSFLFIFQSLPLEQKSPLGTVSLNRKWWIMGYENVTLMNDESVIQCDIRQEVCDVYGYSSPVFPAFKTKLSSSPTTIKTWKHWIWHRYQLWVFITYSLILHKYFIKQYLQIYFRLRHYIQIIRKLHKK